MNSAREDTKEETRTCVISTQQENCNSKSEYVRMYVRTYVRMYVRKFKKIVTLKVNTYVERERPGLNQVGCIQHVGIECQY